MKPFLLRAALATAFAAASVEASARTIAEQAPAPTALPPAAVPPVNVLLPNYDTVPVGEIGSLEAGAFLVRANDTSSVFYNPAGVTRAERTSVSGTAGVFQFDTVTPKDFLKSGTSFQQLPSMFGFVLKDLLGHPNLAGGLAIARVSAWNQSVSAERTFEAGTATDRVSYSSEAAMEGWLVNIGVGYRREDKWRLGGSLDGQLTIRDTSQALGDQYRNGGALSALLIDSQAYAWSTHLRLTLGTQYDITPQVQVGAVIRTGGLGVLSSGSSTLEGVSRSGSTTITASQFDDDATVQYKVPFEFKVGAAYKFTRGEVEIDMLSHLGAGTYEAFNSAHPTTILTDAGGGAVVAQQIATPPSIVDSRAVVNIAVGGHFKLTSDGKWIVHGGYATDRSPVGDQDTLFTKVHLQKVTAGVSGRTKYFLGSLGLQYSSGSSDLIMLRQLPIGQQFSTTFDVSSLGFVYSLAVLF